MLLSFFVQIYTISIKDDRPYVIYSEKVTKSCFKLLWVSVYVSIKVFTANYLFCDFTCIQFTSKSRELQK